MMTATSSWTCRRERAARLMVEWVSAPLRTTSRKRASCIEPAWGVDELPAWLRELANSIDVVGHDGRGPRIEHRLKRAQPGSWGVERNHTFCFHSNGRMNDHRCPSRSIAPYSRKPYRSEERRVGHGGH